MSALICQKMCICNFCITIETTAPAKTKKSNDNNDDDGSCGNSDDA
jgi:hypothetical protein